MFCFAFNRIFFLCCVLLHCYVAVKTDGTIFGGVTCITFL